MAEKPQEPPARDGAPSRARFVGLVLAVIAAVALGSWWRMSASRRREAPAEEASASLAPSSTGAAIPPSPERAERGPRIPAPLRDPNTPPREKIEARLERFLQQTRYPPTNRPLSEARTFEKPDTTPPVLRRVNESSPRIELDEKQDCAYVAEGETAIVTIRVLADGKPAVGVHTLAADLVKFEGTPPVHKDTVEAVSFRDDGVAPDEKAADGTLTAAVPFPAALLGGFVGHTQLTASLSLGEARFDSVFGFVYTGPPPARFTGKVTAAVENGSLVFHVGFEVTNEGAYVVRGRLYDHEGAAVALLSADGKYRATDHEVKLVAFGLLLRDEGAESPLSLRDVEAWRMVSGFPERQKVPTVSGPYPTPKIDPAELSADEWTSPEKEKQVADLKRQLEEAPGAPP